MFYIPSFDGGWVDWVCAALVLSAPFAFLGEARGASPMGYSKFADPRAAALPSRLGMFLVYAPATVAVWLPLLLRGVSLTPWHLLVGGLVTAHFLKRCSEVLFLHRYSGVMNAGSVAMISLIYTTQSALFGEVAATEVGPAAMPVPRLDGPLLLVGLGAWGVGTVGNLAHHWLLARLRSTGDQRYHLPRGGLFPWVAAPHYLFELVAWWGFALVFRHVAAACVALTMTAYLAGRASRTLAWYRERLPGEVPHGWKRLIPHVY